MVGLRLKVSPKPNLSERLLFAFLLFFFVLFIIVVAVEKYKFLHRPAITCVTFTLPQKKHTVAQYHVFSTNVKIFREEELSVLL